MLSLADAQQPYGSTARPQFLARHLARLGHEVLHIGIEPPPLKESRLALLSTRAMMPATQRDRLRFLYSRCSAFAPDVLYTHQRESAMAGLALAPLLGVPHLYDAHTSMAWEVPTYRHLSRLQKQWRLLTERLVLRRVQGVVVPSVELRDWILSRDRLAPERVHLVKNGVETDHFLPGPPDERLRGLYGISEGTPVVGFTNPRIATFPTNDMALAHLFQALPRIARRMPSARVLVFGGGPRPPAPSANFIYTGFVDNIPAHLNLTDLCVAPYPPAAVCGGTRTKVCEYLASGRPVVATREGMRGFDDARPGEHYLLANGVEEFAEAILACLADPELRERLGRSARVLAERYDWGRLAGTLSTVLERTAALAGTKRRSWRAMA